MGHFVEASRVLRARIRAVGGHRRLGLAAFVAAALAVFAALVPGAARAQSIIDLIAPDAKEYGPDYKLPKECEDKCREPLYNVRADMKELAAFDKPEWRDWYEKNAAANAAAANASPDKLKPLQATVDEATKAAKGKAKDSPEVATLKKAKEDAEKPVADKKAADEALKKADGKLPKGNKSSDIKELLRLAKQLQENLVKLKECLEKCAPKKKEVKEGVVPPFDFDNKGCLGKDDFKNKINQAKILARKKLLELDEGTAEYNAWEEFLEKLNKKYDSLSMKVGGDTCPKDGYGFGFPGTPGQQYASTIPGYRAGETVSYSRPMFATDSEAYCTFGEGTGEPGYVTLTDGNGVDIPPSSYGGGTDGTPPGPGPQTVPGGTPKTPPSDTPTDRPSTAMTPQAPKEIPTPQGPKEASTPSPTPSPTPVATTTDKPTPQPSPSNTPVATTTDAQPPQTTTDDNPPIHITIYIKATEAVLGGGQTGEPTESQVVKIVLRNKPERPTTTEGQRTADKHYDKPAPQCITGKGGDCKIEVSEDERPDYGLDNTPRVGGKPAKNYRLAMNVMKHNGAVADVTGKQVPDLKDVVSKGNMTAELIKIGERTFLRIGYNIPKEVTEDLARKFSELLGVPVEIDICLIKEPGPPLGSEPKSYSAINQELPDASINLKLRARRGLR